MAARGLMLSDDLLFVSKVQGVARALGLEVRAVRTPAALVELARQEAPGGVLIDLHNPGLDVAALLGGLAEASGRRPRVVAYGSHVEAATLHAARQAGCDVVLPRSAFVDRLPGGLAAWLAEGGGST